MTKKTIKVDDDLSIDVLHVDMSAHDGAPRIIRTVSEVMTDAEKALLADTLAAATLHLNERHELAKFAASKWRDKIKDAETEVNILANQITEGKINRDVECVEQKLYDIKTVCTVRCDTGQQIDHRPMRPDELQTEIEDVIAEPGEEG